MRPYRRHAHTCDRVRERVCAEIDGELSSFERRLVDAHLRACTDCLDFRRSVHAIAETIRSTPPEPLTSPVVVPLRRRLALGVRSLQLAGATAAVAVMAGVTAWNVVDQRGDVLERKASPVRVEKEHAEIRNTQILQIERRVLSRQPQERRPGPQLPELV